MKTKNKSVLVLAGLIVAGALVSEAGALSSQPAAIVKAGWSNTNSTVTAVPQNQKTVKNAKAQKGLLADVSKVYKFWYAK